MKTREGNLFLGLAVFRHVVCTTARVPKLMSGQEIVHSAWDLL